MSQPSIEARGTTGPLAPSLSFLPDFLLRIAALAVVDAFAITLLYLLAADEVWPLFAAVLISALGVNIINLFPRLYPLRWMSPAFAIIILMVLYPLIFTIYTAFTNYGGGHLYTKPQAARLIVQSQRYLPEGGTVYSWTAFKSSDGTGYGLWLTDPEGNTYFAVPGEELQEARPGEGIYGPAGEDGIPERIEGYERIRLVLPELTALQDLKFGVPPREIGIKSIRDAGEYLPRYVYDDTREVILDQRDGIEYTANDETGYFEGADGAALNPGFAVPVGWSNFSRLLNSPALQGPFIQVFVWTVVFAFMSVVTTFGAGLAMALVLNDPIVPARKLIRSLLILPYAIPGVIGVLIWKGMLNQHLGVITNMLRATIGWSPLWLDDPFWAKVGILLVNLWLGYPYMMLLCSGGLQSIPSDIYEAAQVDGASGWQRFRSITLPLLLVGLGPLLIASFTFNFNNFTIIYAYNKGGPPIANLATPAGHTDILITYTFALAFKPGLVPDYGYASAITIVIFLIVASITLFQYRFTKRWEEVGENV